MEEGGAGWDDSFFFFFLIGGSVLFRLFSNSWVVDSTLVVLAKKKRNL